MASAGCFSASRSTMPWPMDFWPMPGWPDRPDAAAPLPRDARKAKLHAKRRLDPFRVSLNREKALSFVVAVPDAKPLHTFAGTAYGKKSEEDHPAKRAARGMVPLTAEGPAL